MSKIICYHCSQEFDENKRFCPRCNAPTVVQQKKERNMPSKRFIYFFIALIIFCLFMILWLPRENREIDKPSEINDRKPVTAVFHPHSKTT